MGTKLLRAKGGASLHKQRKEEERTLLVPHTRAALNNAHHVAHSRALSPERIQASLSTIRLS